MRQNTSQKIEATASNKFPNNLKKTTVEYPASQIPLNISVHVTMARKEITNNPEPTGTQDP
jgi:hypothetical protein